MKKINLFNFIRIIGFIFFLGILLYPSFSDYLSRMNSSQAISSYKKEVKEIDEETKARMLEEARAYNSSLIGNEELYDPFSNEKNTDSDYMKLLSTSQDGIMGFIQIPAIDVKLPIYHTVKESVLQKGIGHMEGTSLPTGDAGTHAVLSGHRGLPSSNLFTDLDKLKTGDIFYIEVLGNTMAYQIDQIKTVLPTETKDIMIVDGEDHVTLVTCTPYSVNTHRLLVRGTRTDYEKAIEKVSNEVDNGLHIPFEVKILLIVLLILFILLFWIRRRKRV